MRGRRDQRKNRLGDIKIVLTFDMTFGDPCGEVQSQTKENYAAGVELAWVPGKQW